MTIEPVQLLIGIGFAIIVALFARSAGSLSKSGALAAIFMGGITFGLGGLLPAVLLLTFFITSSVLSKIGGARKIQAASAYEKGGERDHGQVLANGGMASFFAILFALSGETVWLVGLVGALASVNADTWSTELGVLARRKPRLITTMKTVEPGTSGGITLEGTLAGLAGAALIAIIAGVGKLDGSLFVAATLGGMSGARLDSFLGATVQVIYFCPVDNKETERHPTHVCGNPTDYLRGWSWLSNDLVNFIASICGSLVSIGIWLVLN
jgi:uncharacterized protein (TIGR00297 family)